MPSRSDIIKFNNSERYKLIAFAEWKNPYPKRQSEIKDYIKKQLNTHNGYVTHREWEDAFLSIRSILEDGKKERKRLTHKLFSTVESSSDVLEWKNGINTIDVVASVLGVDCENLPEPFVLLWNKSRAIEQRSKYPHLILEKRLERIPFDEDFPIYGLGILIRPPALKNETSEPRFSVTASSRSIIVTLHVELDKNEKWIEDTPIIVRVGCGKDVQWRAQIMKSVEAAIPDLKVSVMGNKYNSLVHKIIVDVHQTIRNREEIQKILRKRCLAALDELATPNGPQG